MMVTSFTFLNSNPELRGAGRINPPEIRQAAPGTEWQRPEDARMLGGLKLCAAISIAASFAYGWFGSPYERACRYRCRYIYIYTDS